MIQGTYYKEWSRMLGRDMEFKVYGHAGTPVLALPARGGRAARCVGCGRPYDRHNSTHCGECEDMCVCKACGSVVPKNSGHFLDGDGFYCAECMQPCSCCGKLLPREALRPVLNRRGRTNQLCPSCEEAELANCRTCAAHSCCKDLRGLLFCERSRYTQIELEEQYA